MPSRLKPEKNYKTNFDEELPVFMINETGEQHGRETEYFEEDHSGKEQTGNHTDRQAKRCNRRL